MLTFDLSAMVANIWLLSIYQNIFIQKTTRLKLNLNFILSLLMIRIYLYKLFLSYGHYDHHIHIWFKPAKTLKGKWPWDLVCSIVNVGRIKFVEMMTLGWPWPTKRQSEICFLVHLNQFFLRGDSICNENPFITPSTNALGLYAICQTKDQSVAVIRCMKHYFIFPNLIITDFLKSTLIYTAYIFLRIVKTHFNKGRKACCIFYN